MQIPLILLKHVAKALLNHFGGGVAGEFVFGIAEDVMKAWQRDCDTRARRAELEHIAQATIGEVKLAVAEVVSQVSPDLTEQNRRAITAYLVQIPASIRRTLRRTTDPSGRTVPPGFSVATAKDLTPLLPSRLPRFQPGDYPLAGVDRELVELLGVGGFGEVWKAVNPNRPSMPPVALKFCIDPAAQDRLLRHEAKLLDRVMQVGAHPGIVTLRDTYFKADPPCLEYEFVDGGELTGMIREFHSRGGISPRGAAKIVERLARTVGHFHRLDPPIVHRDLKPANILITTDAAGKIGLKVADFGIGGIAAGREIERFQTSRSRGEPSNSISHGSYSPLYASPEQVRGAPPDPRDDVHALGVIWFQLLMGDLSLGAPTGMDWIEDLEALGMDREQVGVLASCFSSRLERRPADAVMMAAKIAAILPLMEKTRSRKVVDGTSRKEEEDEKKSESDKNIHEGDKPSRTAIPEVQIPTARPFLLKAGGMGAQGHFPVIGKDALSKIDVTPSEPEVDTTMPESAEVIRDFEVPSGATDQEPEPTEADCLFLRGKQTDARGHETEQGFVVRANSRARITAVPSIHPYMIDLRNKLLEQKILSEDGGHLVLTRDYVFDSPSSAAGVMLGRSANGRIEWKDKSGRTLKDIQQDAVPDGESQQ